jgi:uroporphyrinogen-III synthase
MVPVDLVPRHQIAEGLIDQFPAGTGNILIAQAEQARSTLARGLAAKGWHVEVVAAYRSMPIRPQSIDESDIASADAVLFTSGSAVRAWVNVFAATKSPPVIVIGPATALVAQGLGLKVAAVAADHSLDGLVKCLMAYFRERG